MSNLAFTDGQCSFCYARRPVVQKTEKLAVCPACIYTFLIAQDEIPFSSVYCFHCRSIENFTVYRDKSKATFQLAGIDKIDAAIYTLVEAKGDYDMALPITRIQCNTCDSRIPNWMALANGGITP